MKVSCKSNSIVDVQLGSKYASDMYLKEVVISKKSMLLYLGVTLCLRSVKNLPVAYLDHQLNKRFPEYCENKCWWKGKAFESFPNFVGHSGEAPHQACHSK